MSPVSAPPGHAIRRSRRLSIEFIGDVNLRRASACIARSAPIVVLAEALVRHEDLGIGPSPALGLVR